MSHHISVIMPVYNGEKYIASAIESILHQTYTKYEMIIIDDCSTDQTASIIASFAKSDRRIIPLQNEQKMGIYKSCNTALDIARYDWIARLDADDISLSDRFAKQVDYLTTHPDVDLLGGRYIRIDEEGREEGESGPSFETDFLIRWRMLFFNAFITSTMMIRRSLVEKVGRFNTGQPYAQDYDMWIRLMQTGKAANLPDVLVKLRRHAGSVSIQHEKLQSHTALNIAWNHFTSTFPAAACSIDEFLQYRSFFFGGFTGVHTPQEAAYARRWLQIYRTFCHRYPHSAGEQRLLDTWMKNNLLQTRSALLRVPRVIFMFPAASIGFVIKTTFRSLLVKFGMIK